MSVAVSAVVALIVGVAAAAVALRVGGSRRGETDDGETPTDALDRQMTAVSVELGDLHGLVQQLRVERADQHGELRSAMAEAAEGRRRLIATTAGLEEALSNSRSRGQWGERTADDILRHAGFVEGVGYVRQTAVASGGIPDFTFLLPEGRLLHMDVKFPADNYLRSLQAEGQADRERFEKAFMADVRARVKELADRGYADADEACDAVLLFIPVEAIYGSMHELDPDLLDEALAQGVVLCSPASLFAVLAVVRRTIEDHVVERTADEILTCLAAFTKQWDLFVDQMDKVAKQLGTVQGSFDQLTGTRRNQLDRQLVRVDDLRSRHMADELESPVGA